MANVRGSNDIAGVAPAKGPARLQDVVQLIGAISLKETLPSGYAGYDHIVSLMGALNLDDDGITLNRKVKAIEQDFVRIVRDDAELCDCMMHINSKALEDESLAPKFPLLFSSRNFDVVSNADSQVLGHMLRILEINFLESEQYRLNNRQRLYNSITIMGEFYNRTRLSPSCPINILGQTLLKLFHREFEDTGLSMDVLFARSLLAQIKLNGNLFQTFHSVELSELMNHIRRFLIVQPMLQQSMKALLLMCLDVCMANFKPLSEQLEAFYLAYQTQKDSFASLEGASPSQQQSFARETSCQPLESVPQATSSPSANELPWEEAAAEPEVVRSTKKWSEQVCEESLLEGDFSFYEQQVNDDASHVTQTNAEFREGDSNARRSFPPQNEPRPLKSNQHQANGSSSGPSSDSKHQPPQWRAHRLSESGAAAHVDYKQQNNINDRLRYNQQDHVEQGSSNHWKRYSRREERGSFRNNRGGGGYHNGNNGNNNRHIYDKPPRFLKKNDSQHQHQQQQLNTWAWRGRSDYQHDENNQAFQSSGNEMQSRSSSRARTLPRPSKSKMDDKQGGGGERYEQQSPGRSNAGQQRNFNGRYGSQSSLASDASGSRRYQHHHYPHSRNFTRRYNQPKDHDKNANNEEQIVRDAQKTTEFMNYLCQK